jgi:hypothetical protein
MSRQRTSTQQPSGKPISDTFPTEDEMFKQLMITVESAWQNHLSKSHVEQWLANFKAEVFDLEYERRLALWLLCNFVFYNHHEVRHLCRTAYQEFLHFTLKSTPINPGDEWDQVANRVLENTRFYHLGKAGESGGYVLYYFRQENGLGVRQFLTSPEKLPHNVDTIVFVDDVVLSGTQADQYLQRATGSIDKDKRKILLTFFSTAEAEKLLAAEDITVLSCIKLDERCRCFSQQSDTFANHPVHRDHCKQLAEHYGAKLIPSSPLGYNDGQYSFGFYYNTPDNTLPIFWSERNGWHPVMKRYDKKYGKGGSNELGRFI